MFKFYISILPFLLLLSCNKENETPASLVPLCITPSVSVQSTKALIEGTGITSQTIGVQVTNTSTNTLYQNGTDNIALTYSSSWNMANTIYLSSTPAKIYAYSPYSSTTGDFTGIGTSAKRLLDIQASRVMANQVDYLWAAQTTSGGSSISASNASVALAMNHSQAQIAFVIYKENYAGAGNLSQITITDNSATPSLKINKTSTNDLAMSLADGTISGGQTSSAITVTGVNSTISLTSNPGTSPSTLNGLKNGYVLMAPASITDGTKVTLTFTIDGNNFSVPLSGNITWLKGNQYIYTVKLSPKAVTISDVILAPWITNTVSKIDADPDDILPTANCYIVAPSGSITIPVNIKGNGDITSAALGSITTTLTAASMGKVWETTNGLVSLSNFTTKTVTVTASASEGNAVIAAYDSDGTTILWSWHIWVTDTPAEESVNGFTWMDRNLGATDIANGTSTSLATCGGLLYQWGRKDPFPGSNGSKTGSNVDPLTIYNFSTPSYTGLTIYSATNVNDPIKITDASVSPISYTNQLLYSIKYPLLLFKNWGGSTAKIAATNTTDGGIDSWGGEYGQTKSIYDPCPSGWRVPSGKKSSSTYSSPWSTWSTQPLTSSTYAAIRWYNGSYLSTYHYPASGYKNQNDGYINQVGTAGNYYSASANSTGSSVYILYFENNAVSIQASSRPQCVSIRCVRE